MTSRRVALWNLIEIIHQLNQTGVKAPRGKKEREQLAIETAIFNARSPLSQKRLRGMGQDVENIK